MPSAIRDPETARLTLFLAGLALLFMFESVVHSRPWHASRGRRLLFHAIVSATNAALIRLTIAGPLLLLTDAVYRAGWGIGLRLGLTGSAGVAAAVIVLDGADYWWHRFNHRVPFLWRFHRIHHVDTHVDVTTSLRFHPGELLLSGAARATWIVAWGPSVATFALFEALITLASQYHHSNIDLPDRIEPTVRALNVTPRMHTSHHSALTPSLHANLSTIFSVWDRLFGTYIEPTEEHLRLLGLPYGRDRDLNLAYWLWLPFRSEKAGAPASAPPTT